MSSPAVDAINLFELERIALERLSPAARDYYVSGGHDEITLRDNRAAFDRIRLWPHCLADVARRDLATRVLGTPIGMPLLVAPTAFQRLAHPDGEIAAARAAKNAGSVMVLSNWATTSIEDVAAVGGVVWQQLYMYRDREASFELVARAEKAGAQAIVLTVDSPLLGRRERDVRNRFRLPDGLTMPNMSGRLANLPPEAADSGLAAYVAQAIDQTLSWGDIHALRAHTRLPIVLKGVLRADDARKAVDHGVNGIIVSNHGGRQLDTAPAAVDALPHVAAAVAGRSEVYMDGGVRRGTDVVKALALGARAVLLGRPVLWGLAAAGEAGVAHALNLLRAEIDLAFALVGCKTVHEIDTHLLNPG